jgi:hypothetical protein
LLAAALGLWPVLLVGCQEQLPTQLPGASLPGEPITFQIVIPWSEFAADLEVFGGYGSPEDLGSGVLANQYTGTLNARTLMRFAQYPQSVVARDSTGATRPDSSIVFVGGRLVTFFDTIASTNTGPIDVALAATQVEWHGKTTTWDFAIDTINDQRPWPEPGGGPVTEIDTATWDPATGDSAVFVLDSAQVAAWADTTDLAAGARLEVLDTGERIRLRGAALRLDARPSSAPDTLIEATTFTRSVTFMYTPNPAPPPEGIRIGGAPSWRTVMDIDMPTVIDGPAEFCALVACPHTLTPGEISFAALILTSRTTDPAFQPSDSIRLDVRPVTDRAAMPKSPLGNSLIEDPFGRAVDPAAFGSASGLKINVPFTKFARDALRGLDEDGNVAATSLALLSVLEPFSISFASFEGPGTAGEPILTLILTIGPPVELP